MERELKFSSADLTQINGFFQNHQFLPAIFTRLVSRTAEQGPN